MMDDKSFNPARFKKRRDALVNEFSERRSHYQEIADFFSPRAGHYLRAKNRSNRPMDVGRKMNQHIIDSTTTRVARNAAAGLQAGITSPSRPWKRLGPSDLTKAETNASRKFFGELDRRFDAVVQRSNFHQSAIQAYGDYTKFGPGAVQVDEHEDEVFRCTVHPIGSWTAAKNSDGVVDVFYRDYRVTGHDLLGRFGEEPFDKQMLQEIDRNPYAYHDLRNAIEPNPYYRRGQPAIGLAAFPFISVWWMDRKSEKFLKVHGYHEFPVMVFNMYVSEQSDVYGYGAGVEALGDGKQLQHMQRMKLKGIDKMVDPAMQAPMSLLSQGVTTVPGEMNYHDSQQKIESLYNVNLPIQYVREDIAETQQRLKEAFFEDLFLMITNSIQRQTTAREIEERHQEKLVMLGPVLEALIQDWLDPFVNRVLNIMQRAGLWPDAPEELVDTEIKVEYVSILATAQRAVQTIAIEQGVNFAAQAEQFGLTGALDRVDVDGVVEAYFERIGFPPEGIRGKDEAEAIRQQRAAMLQQQQQMEMAQAGASAAADASKADMTQPNVLTQMLGQVAAA